VTRSNGARDASRAFTRTADLPGWSRRSIWGYDETFECYWAELRRGEDRTDAPRIRISRDHLIPTPAALARAIADKVGIDHEKVWLALVDPVRSLMRGARAVHRGLSTRAQVGRRSPIPAAGGHPRADRDHEVATGPED